MDQRSGFWSFNVQNSRNLSPSQQEVSYLLDTGDSVKGQCCGPWAPGLNCIRLRDQWARMSERGQKWARKENWLVNMTKIVKKGVPVLGEKAEYQMSLGRITFWGSAWRVVDHRSLPLMAMPSLCGAHAGAIHSSCTVLIALIGCWLAGEPAQAGSEEGRCVPSRCSENMRPQSRISALAYAFPHWVVLFIIFF